MLQKMGVAGVHLNEGVETEITQAHKQTIQ